MKKISLLLLALSFFSLTQFAYAQSAYVLPYPSVMPGGINYKLHLVWEKIMQYWYFGDFGQFTYNLNESDKYLVEAKTLFEYQQYLLGYEALQKSNDYFQKTLPYLIMAKKHGKNISEDRVLLSNASEKHIEVLQKMEQENPKTFHWSPEKTTAFDLQIQSLIERAIAISKQYL